jgi:hypothetical protein
VAEGEEEQDAASGQEGVGGVGFDAVGFGVGKDERLWVRAAFETDAGQVPDGAVCPVAADHIARRERSLRTVGAAQPAYHCVAGRLHRGQLGLSLDRDAGGGEVFFQDAFGFGLGQK